jgi:hypothetical protein
MMPEERVIAKTTQAVTITDEAVETSQLALNALLEAAVEKIERTRALIAKLDELLAKRL